MGNGEGAGLPHRGLTGRDATGRRRPAAILPIPRSGGSLDPDGHDIGVVILLVVDRRRDVAQQAQRKLLFRRRPPRPARRAGRSGPAHSRRPSRRGIRGRRHRRPCTQRGTGAGAPGPCGLLPVAVRSARFPRPRCRGARSSWRPNRSGPRIWPGNCVTVAARTPKTAIRSVLAWAWQLPRKE